MEFDGNLDIKAREIEDLKKSPEELTRQAAMRWADGQIDPLLPLPPFFLHIVGGIGKGKTTIILNMLREYQRVNTFCRVIYLSPSGKNDAKLRMFLTADNSNFNYTPENLKAIIQNIQKENAESKRGTDTSSSGPTPVAGSQGLSVQELKRRIQKKVPATLGAGASAALSGLANAQPAFKTKEDLARQARQKVSCRTLIIADDATGSILTARNSAFTEFLVSIRHEDTSIILCTHSDTSLSAQLRAIVTSQILFEPGNDLELKNLSMDIGGINVKQLSSVLDHVRRVPHGFLFVDKKRPFRDRFILNFKNVLEPDAFKTDAKPGTAESNLQLFRSGGFLPTPAQATSSEARFSSRAYALQQEATLVNRGLTPADKILAEQNASAKRQRQVQSSSRTSTAKRATHEDIGRAAKLQRTNDAVRVSGAIRSQAFRTSQAARLTQVSQAGGVLDAKFQRGVSRNVAIATGGRRGIGGRGRRGAAALGPLAQQLEESIRTQQALKAQQTALTKDEEARKAEAAKEATIPAPPPLPAQTNFELAVKDSALAFSQSRTRRAQEQNAAAAQVAQSNSIGNARAALNQELSQLIPVESNIQSAFNTEVAQNQPLTQQEQRSELQTSANVLPMNIVDSEAHDVPGPQEGKHKSDQALEALPPLPPSPVPDAMELLAPPAPKPTPDSGAASFLAPRNSDSTSGPPLSNKGPTRASDELSMNFAGSGATNSATNNAPPIVIPTPRPTRPVHREAQGHPPAGLGTGNQRISVISKQAADRARRAQQIQANRDTGLGQSNPLAADPVPLSNNTPIDKDNFAAPAPVNATGGLKRQLSGKDLDTLGRLQQRQETIPPIGTN